MPSYEILWKRSAVKELKQLPKETIKKIHSIVTGLSDNPLPEGVRKLVGSEHTFRIRSGDYRIVYSIRSEKLTVEIIRVGHRKDIYK
jgi:mRNA interferase RelE/StbE